MGKKKKVALLLLQSRRESKSKKKREARFDFSKSRVSEMENAMHIRGETREKMTEETNQGEEKKERDNRFKILIFFFLFLSNVVK